MEILWLIVGAVAGALLVWSYFSVRFGNRIAARESELAAREAELQAENLKYKEAADEEREAREKTRALVTELEGKLDASAEQTKTLSADLELRTGELGTERNAHAETREKLTQAEADGKSAGEQADILRSELDDFRKELETSKAAAADGATKLGAIQTERDALNGKLSEERSARERLETDLQDARAQLSSAGSEDRARVADLEGQVRDRDAEIERLRAQGESSGNGQSEVESAPEPEKEAAAEEVPAQDAGPVDPLPVDASVSADDLTKIKGIGPVLKDKLHALGITSFRQIADFTDADIERVNEVLNFPGRIERERWVEQAREMADA